MSPPEQTPQGPTDLGEWVDVYSGNVVVVRGQMQQGYEPPSMSLTPTGPEPASPPDWARNCPDPGSCAGSVYGACVSAGRCLIAPTDPPSAAVEPPAAPDASPATRPCRNDLEPDGEPCTGMLTFEPGAAQAKCPSCGAWEGVLAPPRVTGTPEAPSGAQGPILGRALLAAGDDDGHLFLQVADGRWHNSGWGDLTRTEIEADVGKAVEVLLVDPAAGPVLDAAVAWVGRAKRPGASHPNLWADDEDFALIAAVDALTDTSTDTPPADGEASAQVTPHAEERCDCGQVDHNPTEACLATEPDAATEAGMDADAAEFAALPDCQHCGGTGKQVPDGWYERRRTAERHAAEVLGPAVERYLRLAAPAPASDGPGWNRERIAELADEARPDGAGLPGYPVLSPADGAQLRALLDSHDRQTQVASNLFELAERRFVALERATKERDAAEARCRRYVRRLDEEEAATRATRAELATIRRQLADTLEANRRWAAHCAEVEAERDQAHERVTLADSRRAAALQRADQTRREADRLRDRVDGDAWHKLETERDRLERLTAADRETLARLREKLGEAATMGARYIAKYEDAQSALATARRDGAADTLAALALHIQALASHSGGETHRRGLLRAAYAAEQWATEVRAGTREVPTPASDQDGDTP